MTVHIGGPGTPQGPNDNHPNWALYNNNSTLSCIMGNYCDFLNEIHFQRFIVLCWGSVLVPVGSGYPRDHGMQRKLLNGLLRWFNRDFVSFRKRRSVAASYLSVCPLVTVQIYMQTFTEISSESVGANEAKHRPENFDRKLRLAKSVFVICKKSNCHQLEIV